MPSSVIRHVDYDDKTRRLDILFVTGRRYSYHGVPARIVAALRAAPSMGRFFNAKIRDRFAFTRRPRG
jgi:hypothetical protein